MGRNYVINEHGALEWRPANWRLRSFIFGMACLFAGLVFGFLVGQSFILHQ